MLPTSHARPAVRRRPHSVVCRGVLGAGLVAALASTALAQTFVVDNQSLSASDLGPGSELQPYRTIAAAAAAHRAPGITILVKPGIYREQVTVPASGAADSPFVFQAAGAGVQIDGSDDFASPALWTPSLGTAFLAAGVSWTPKQVYVDGARLAATSAAPDLMPAGSFRWVSGEGLYVNLGADNPGAHVTLVGRRNYGFNVFTKSFVTLDGFEIAHTEDRGINLQNGCTDLVVSHNRVSFANSYGIQTVNGQRIVIEANTVSDCNFHGIGLTAGASGCTVRGNDSFRNAHPTIRQANGIYLYGSPSNTICGNRLHENQDTGLHFATGSNDCVSFNNCSWANGDHGYDHLQVSGTVHVNDVAYGNLLDGFSFEGDAPGSQLHNCIAAENGLTRNEFDLWVDASSSVGFVSDHNLFWNSTSQAPVKFVTTLCSTLADYQAVSGLDAHSLQADPRFVNAAAADFHLLAGSPAIDAATSAAAGWPATDAGGAARLDDPRIADTGEGPVTFGDLGAFEFVDVGRADGRPVVVSPAVVRASRGQRVEFTVTASDPDGDAIQSLRMVPLHMAHGSTAVFAPSADHTSGVLTLTLGKAGGHCTVRFVAANALEGSDTTSIVIRNNAPVPGTTGNLITGAQVALSQGYPNPAASGVALALDLPEDAPVDWGVYDMQGRLVWSESRAASAGRIELRWSGRDLGGRIAGKGLYFIRVRAGESEFVRRVVHL